MARTMIGNKKSLIDFIEKNMSDDDVSIMTDDWLKCDVSKKGLKIQFQYATDTFKDEKGIGYMMEAKNVALWIGKPQNVSEDTKQLFLNEQKDTNDSKSRTRTSPAGRKGTKCK
jgi:hypothetical protein